MTDKELEVLKLAMGLNFREARFAKGIPGVIVNGCSVRETRTGQLAVDRGDGHLFIEYTNTPRGAVALLMNHNSDWKKPVLDFTDLPS